MRAIHRACAGLALLVLIHLSFLWFRRSLESPVSPSVHPPAQEPLHKEPPQDSPPPTVKEPVPPPPREALCQYTDCLKGKWVPREPKYTSPAHFKEAFPSKWDRCPIPRNSAKSREDKELKETRRLVNIMNWVWQPDRKEQVSWDAMDFVVRLLKTPGGIVFVGDETSSNHEEVLLAYLDQSGIKFDKQEVTIKGEPTSQIRPNVLRPGHPKTLELQRRAGVPDSRLLRPVVSGIHDDMLIPESEILEIVRETGGSADAKWEPKDAIKQVEGWEGWLKDVTEPHKSEASAVTHETMVVLNTGVHWSRWNFGMLPIQTSGKKRSDPLTLVYTEMMNRIITRLSNLTQTTIVYRTTSPGHPACEKKKHPYTDFLTAHQNEWNLVDAIGAAAKTPEDKEVQLTKDWNLFNPHNQLWRRRIKMLESERQKAIKEKEKEGAGDVPAKWLFMDVWDMVLQRPDAHALDCVHWCLPAIHIEWVHHLYHVLYLETEK